MSRYNLIAKDNATCSWWHLTRNGSLNIRLNIRNAVKVLPCINHIIDIDQKGEKSQIITFQYLVLTGHRYLIKDQKYWQYDIGRRTVAPGYPKLFAFLDCH